MAVLDGSVQEGFRLPGLDIATMDRLNLVRMALFLHDANPVHLDRVYARERGLPDVIQQGPLNVAYLIRMLMEWAGPEASLVDISIRFRASAHPGEVLQNRGQVLRRYQMDGRDHVLVELTQTSSTGAITLKGKGTVRWTP